MKLRVLELFAGTRSIGKAFERNKHQVVSIEWDEQFENIDRYMDIEHLTVQDVYDFFDGSPPHVIWASPDCTTYSIAACSTHRNLIEVNGITQYRPKSTYAKKCDLVNNNMLDVIDYFSKKYGTLFFIENPRGIMRKIHFMQEYAKYTITYCQYGDMRMKPTDIFTNHPNPNFKPMCKNGAPCHEPAPRGSKTGTQGLKKVDRSKIPDELCNHIVSICERGSF